MATKPLGVLGFFFLKILESLEHLVGSWRILRFLDVFEVIRWFLSHCMVSKSAEGLVSRSLDDLDSLESLGDSWKASRSLEELEIAGRSWIIGNSTDGGC